MNVLDELLSAVSTAEVKTEPFRHYVLPAAFSEQTYATLLAALPPLSAYDAFSHRDSGLEGQETRYHLWLNEQGLRPVAEPERGVWAAVAETMTSDALKAAIFAKLGVEGDGVPKPLLCRDLQGWLIKPHPDSKSKIVTCQFYFPQNDERAHLGTEFYRKRGERFETVKTIPFRPNHGYAFKVTADSWHGVKRHELSSPRDSLLLIYYKE